MKGVAMRYAIEVETREANGVITPHTVRFHSSAKTLPGLMAAAHRVYAKWLTDARFAHNGDIARLPDFVPYKIERRYDFDRDRFTYERHPVCDIYGQLC